MIKHSVIMPDGRTATRDSRSRTYLYAVVALPDYTHALARANQISSMDAANFTNYLREADTQRYNTKPRDPGEYRAQMLGLCRGAKTPDEFARLMRDARVTDIKQLHLKGLYDRWSVVGWSSRLDLANARAARESGSDTADVRIIKTNHHPDNL